MAVAGYSPEAQLQQSSAHPVHSPLRTQLGKVTDPGCDVSMCVAVLHLWFFLVCNFSPSFSGLAVWETGGQTEGPSRAPIPSHM